MEFFASELAEWTGGRWSRSPSSTIRGFTIDSRRVQRGDCFVALKTDRRDGHDYLADAVERGAVAAIVENVVEVPLPQLCVQSSEKALQDCALGHRMRLKIPVIGITGSCGKTSTKDLLALLLGSDQTLSTEANLNNTLGVPLTLLRIDESKHRFAVVEAGINQPGEMAILSRILQPSHGMVTMVGMAHGEGLGSVDMIAREKCRLLEAVAAGGLVVFPESCAKLPGFFDLDRPGIHILGRDRDGPDSVTYNFRITQRGSTMEARKSGRDRQTDIDTEIRDTETSDETKQVGVWENRLRLVLPALPVFSVSLPNMTEGMASNAAMAVAVARTLGVPAGLLAERLQAWKASPGRGEVLEIDERVYYVDCYNANPSSMLDAIRYFQKRWYDSAKLYVLGTMNELGDSFVSGHREVGAALNLQLKDQAVFVGKGGEFYREGAEASGASVDALTLVDKVDSAKEIVETFRGTVLLKGSRSQMLERLLPSSESSYGSEAIAC